MIYRTRITYHENVNSPIFLEYKKPNPWLYVLIFTELFMYFIYHV